MAEHLNFSKEDIHMTYRLMKRCSVSLITREVQVKTIVRYSVTMIRMAIIKKSTDK